MRFVARLAPVASWPLPSSGSIQRAVGRVFACGELFFRKICCAQIQEPAGAPPDFVGLAVVGAGSHAGVWDSAQPPVRPVGVARSIAYV